MDIKLLESIYIIYILIFFKTYYSIHHPFEILIQNKTNKIKLLQHPIYSTRYESKICNLGKIVGVLLVLWIYNRNALEPKQRYLYNKIIWFIVLVLGFIMNINFFIYLLPVSLIDMIYIK